MPEAVNLGSGRGAGWLNDANTEIKNLFSNTLTIGSFAMLDSATNAAFTVPVGRKLTILTVDYIAFGGVSGTFYLHSYLGGVFVGTKFKMDAESGNHYTIQVGLEFSAGQQVYVQNPGASVSCNCFGVESTV